MKQRDRFVVTACAVFLPAAALSAQESLEQRIERLEQQNRALQQRVDGLGVEVERTRNGGLAPGLGDGRRANDKVASIEQGLALGGYGEFVYADVAGRTDVADILRAVLFVGYRFDEHWSFNSELEVEHAATEASSGTTDEGGEVAFEFAHLEYRFDDHWSARAGLLLMPVGLVNRDHEPTSFLPVRRAQTETRILPTTWSEPGLQALGRFGDFECTAALVAGLDGERFEAEGIREARQHGNRAAAEDLALALCLDWHGSDDLVVGGSAYRGSAGQDGLASGAAPIPSLDTTILDAHFDWRPGAFVVRGLYAAALVQDAGAFDAALSTNVASRMAGYYGELGYDVMRALCPDSGHALLPFVRYEHIDTQQRMPGGVARDPAQDDEILTFGVHWRPIAQIAIKADYENWDHDPDRFQLSFGYVF